jgi:hypothetical protein
MSTNTHIWDALKKTDPNHTKNFKRAGGFSGTAIKPIYCTLKLTELFGPCGVGWGMDKPEFQTVCAGEDIAVYCTAGLWYIYDGAKAQVYGVGGDFVRKTNKNGPFVDDEAFKKSYTDALSNAMKQIGVGADVHMGQFEDIKYVNELKQEFSDKKAPPQKKVESNELKEAKIEAEAISKAIKTSPHVTALESLVDQVTPQLEKIKSISELAYEDLMHRVNLKFKELRGEKA